MKVPNIFIFGIAIVVAASITNVMALPTFGNETSSDKIADSMTITNKISTSPDVVDVAVKSTTLLSPAVDNKPTSDVSTINSAVSSDKADATPAVADNIPPSDTLALNATVLFDKIGSGSVADNSTVTSIFDDKLNNAMSSYNFAIVNNGSCIQSLHNNISSLQTVFNNLNSSVDDAISALTQRKELGPIFELCTVKPQFQFDKEVKENLSILWSDISGIMKEIIEYLLNGDAFVNFKSFESQIFSHETGSIRPLFEKTLAINVSQVFEKDLVCYQTVNGLDKNLNTTTMELINGMRDLCINMAAIKASLYLEDSYAELTEIFSMVEMTVGRLMTERLPEYAALKAEDLHNVSRAFTRILTSFLLFFLLRSRAYSMLLRMKSFSVRSIRRNIL